MPPEHFIVYRDRVGRISREFLSLYYGAVPQRYIAGLPATTTQESPMPRTFTNSIGATVTIDQNGIYPMLKTDPKGGSHAIVVDRDVPTLAFELFNQSSRFRRDIKHTVMDGKPTIKVGGDGSLAGMVYKPTTAEQAERNLNFAIANLAAYEEWERVGRKNAEIREANLKAAEKRAAEEKKREEEARRQKELVEAKLRAEKLREERKRRDALAFYNKVNGTHHYTWASLGFIGENAIKEWIKLSETSKGLRSPFANGGNTMNYPTSSPYGYLSNSTRSLLGL